MLPAKLPNAYTPAAPSDLARRLLVNVSEVIDERTEAGIQVVPATLTYGCDGLPRLNPLDGTGCDPEPQGQLVLGARLNGTLTLLTKSITAQLGGASASLGRKEKMVMPMPRRPPSVCYAGTDEDTAGTLGFYRSVDGGLTWAGRPSVSGAGGLVYGLLHAPGGALYAAAGTAGVYRSDDDGLTWSQSLASFGGADVRSLAHVPQGSILLAGTFGSGLFRSLDGGATWARSVVLGHGLDVAARIYSVAVLRNGAALVSTEKIYVTVGEDVVLYGGVYRLSGGAWVQLSFPGGSPADAVNAWGVDRNVGGSSSGAWAALSEIGDGYSPLYKTTDNGSVFQEAYSPFGDYSRRLIKALAPDIASPRSAFSAAISSVCYAGGNSSDAFGNGVVKTTDGGVTWSGSLSLQDVSALAIDPQSPTHVLAGSSSGSGIFATHDAGVSWDDVSDGLASEHGGLNVNALVVG